MLAKTAPQNVTKHFSVLALIEREPEENEFGASQIRTTIGCGAVVCLASKKRISRYTVDVIGMSEDRDYR